MASQYLARLGIVLGIDSGELVQGITDAKKQFHDFRNQVEKDTKAAAREFEALKNATEDYGKTLTKVEQIQREIDRGRFMFASQNVKDKLLEQARAYDAQAASMKKAVVGLTDMQKMQVGYQVTDFFTQIASGQNAMIAFIQQGGQLKDSMGGVGNAFRAILSFINPVNLAIAAVGVTIGSVGYAAYKASEELADFNKAMGLAGGFAGTTYGEMLQLGNALQSSVGGSIGKARDVMMALVDSGKFTKASLSAVGEAVLQFARVAGVDGKEAAAKLIPLLDGTASSAKSLNDRYHMLTLAQYKQIEALERQGKLQESIQLQAKLLTKQFEDVEVKLGTLQQLWKDVGEWASWAWQKMLNVGREDDTVIQLEKINSEIVKTMKTIAEKRALGMNTQLMDSELEKLKAKFQTTLDKLTQESEAAAAKAKAKELASAGIGIYAKAGGAEGEMSPNKAAKKAQFDRNIALAEMYASEEMKIEIELQKKLGQALIEEEEQNQKTFWQFKQKYMDERIAKEQVAEAEAVRKRREFRLKKDIEAFDKETEVIFRLEKEREKIFADIAAKRDEQKYAKESLDAKFSLIGATQKEIDITMARIESQKELDKLMRSQEFKNMSSEKQELAKKELEDVLKAKEANIELAESLQRVQGVYDAVWGAMSSAIENFVRTGKLSIKDFTRSVIQDMLIMQMKLQAMQLVRGLIGSLFPSANVGSNFASGVGTGVTGFGSSYADGGSPTPNTINLVGERGPELFIPQTAGTIIPNDKLMSGGNTTNVTNNYINAIDTKSFEQRLLESNQAIWSANQYANKSLASNGRRA